MNGNEALVLLRQLEVSNELNREFTIYKMNNMANFKEVSCPNCQRIVRSTDRFCIFCGNKMQPQDAAPAKSIIPEPERKELEKEVDKNLHGTIQGLDVKKGDSVQKNANVPFVPTSPISETVGTEDAPDRKKDSKKKDSNSISTDLELTIDMPIEIRDQLEAKMALAVIENKKKVLRGKIDEVSKQLEDDRFEMDFDYQQEVNLKFDALKSVKEELNEEEEKYRNQLGERFIVDRLEDTLEEKRQQLIELQRSYKTKNIKKDIYEQLKQEYTSKFSESEKELHDLRMNIVRWLSKEKSDKNKLDAKIRLQQGRMKSGELSKADFEQEKAEIQKDVEKIEQRIKILELYARERQKRFF